MEIAGHGDIFCEVKAEFQFKFQLLTLKSPVSKFKGLGISLSVKVLDSIPSTEQS